MTHIFIKGIRGLLIFFVFFAILEVNVIRAQDAEFDKKYFKSHIKYLSSEKLEGRYPGTSGDSLAADYILKKFKTSNLFTQAPYGFQEFTFSSSVVPGDNNFLRFNNTDAAYWDDFICLEFSANKELSAEVVFAGYGFDINTKDIVWEDYNSVNVKDKWVMILKGDPEPNRQNSIFENYSNKRHKVFVARDKGAAGVIFVSGKTYDPDDNLIMFSNSMGRVNIPVIQVTRTIADKILINKNTDIKSLEKKLNDNLKPNSFYTGQTVSAKSDLKYEEISTFNIIGKLNVNKKNEYIVIGAHYDHLGMGGYGTNSRRPQKKAIHPGADDNASGVSALIETAKYLSDNRDILNTNILFVAFGAEEKGLLGSRFFVDNPPVPISSIKAMINIDMIGRMRDDNSLYIGGVGTAKEFRNIINNANKYDNLDLILSEAGYGPSDHASFYAKDIPVLFFFTGMHTDYHTPDDTEDKINYNGILKTSRLVTEVIKSIDKSEQISFRRAGAQQAQQNRHSDRKVSLGIMPDVASDNINGVRAEVVIPDRAAYNGNMQNGDIITAINGKKINDIHEYMYRLSKLEPGEIINVDVIRDDQELVLIIKL